MIIFCPARPVVVERGADRPATGPIWVELDGGAFPAGGWDDFVVVIATALCTAVARLVAGASRRETVHFMDGPHQLVITREDGGARIEAQTAARQVGATWHELGPLATELLDYAERLDAVLERTRDSIGLCDAILHLKDAVNQACAQSPR